MRDIGKNIKQLRKIKNITQDELAQKLFVTRQTVSNYEIGRTRPDIEMLTKLAEVLEVDVQTVLYGLPEPVSRKTDIIRSCIAVLGVAVMFAVVTYLGAVAKDFMKMYYDNTLMFWIKVVLQPAAYFAAGWTLCQVLGTFTKLAPLSLPCSKWIRFAVILSIVIYFVLMTPYLFAETLRWGPPLFWERIVSFLLGALPGFYAFSWNYVVALFGVVFWLFPFKKKVS